MGDHKQVQHLRLYVKVPGTDKLRKNADGRLRNLLADGWRETGREIETDFVRVKVERSGHRPPMMRIPKAPPAQPRTRRDGGGFRGGPGGPGGFGGPQGQRGGPQRGAPADAPAAAPVPAAEPAPATPAA